MPKERLRESLDDALAFQRLCITLRQVIRQMLDTHPCVNDELTIVMITTHNGLGNILVQLYGAIEIIQERMLTHGDGEGIEKKLLAQFKEENDNEEEEYEDYQYEDPNDEPSTN